MIRAVIYARYSSNNQRDASIEDQISGMHQGTGTTQRPMR